MKAKNQSNTDHQLREAVMTQLEWEPEAPDADIGVSVSEGVVTLTGFVNTYSEKLAAEKAVKLVRGVRGIANDLVVRPFSQPIDTDIVKTALHTLESDVRVPADKIIVTPSSFGGHSKPSAAARSGTDQRVIERKSPPDQSRRQ